MAAVEQTRPKAPLIYNPKVRSIAYQAVLCAVILFLVWSAIYNAAENLARAKIASGFGFWENTAGFDISQTLIEYQATSTYGRAFWVGLINTLLVAGLGIVFATILGFVIGIARLSTNWLLARLAGFYVETIRNIPLLLQLLFWYNAVLKALPGTRESLAIPGGGFLNNRGLFLPQPVFEPAARFALIALVVGIVAAIGYRAWARRRQMQTGQQAPVLWVSLGLVIALPLAVLGLSGFPISFNFTPRRCIADTRSFRKAHSESPAIRTSTCRKKMRAICWSRCAPSYRTVARAMQFGWRSRARPTKKSSRNCVMFSSCRSGRCSALMAR